MKITAGIACADHYPRFIEAGADEVFCGYVPDRWTSRWRLDMPLNRREACYCPVQIGGRNELRILAAMQRDYRKPVALTFNALCYRPEQYAEISDILLECMEDGFHTFIIADPGLLFFLRQNHFPASARIHLSGETGEISSPALSVYRELTIDRVIFHRKAGLMNMAEIIRKDRACHPDEPISYEAFIMNELCHFTGAFCSGLHSDEFCHPCHIPWKTGPVRSSRGASAVSRPETKPEAPDKPYLPGQSGCGICSLPALASAGIDVLKVVGRGADPEEMVRDIAALKKALTLLDQIRDPARWKKEMFTACFPEGCGQECYYREIPEASF